MYIDQNQWSSADFPLSNAIVSWAPEEHRQPYNMNSTWNTRVARVLLTRHRWRKCLWIPYWSLNISCETCSQLKNDPFNIKLGIGWRTTDPLNSPTKLLAFRGSSQLIDYSAVVDSKLSATERPLLTAWLWTGLAVGRKICHQNCWS